MKLTTRIAVCLTLAGLFVADAQDPTSRRVTVRKGEVRRGSYPATIRAIETPGLFTSATTDEDFIKAFIRVSEVGGTGVWFDLQGIVADGTALDPGQVAGLRSVKSECIYRYIVPICRLFGPGAPEDAAYRMATVRTVAEVFKADHAMVYWIDGAKSDELVAEFKSIAPGLVVLSPRGGDIDLIYSAKEAREGHASLLAGAIPEPITSALHCAMPASADVYDRFEEANTHPLEREPWTPETVGLSAGEKADGFVSLFNGTSLDAWIIKGPNQKAYMIKDGAIEWVAPGGVALRTRKRYADYVLRFEWKLFAKGANSGFHLRTPRENRASKMGFEFQMFGDPGIAPDIHSTGSIYDVLAPLVNASAPIGEWNTTELDLSGPRYKATLNGQVVQDLSFDDNPELKFRLRRGFIALSDHESRVAVRNIRIKEQ